MTAIHTQRNCLLRWQMNTKDNSQQSYVLDLRSKEKYDKDHIVGAVNIEYGLSNTEELIEKIPSDWSVYIIADNDEEGAALAASLKEYDEYLFVYTITGGYEALLDAEGIEKYITTIPGEFNKFTRTEAREKFEAIKVASE